MLISCLVFGYYQWKISSPDMFYTTAFWFYGVHIYISLARVDAVLGSATESCKWSQNRKKPCKGPSACWCYQRFKGSGYTEYLRYGCYWLIVIGMQVIMARSVAKTLMSPTYPFALDVFLVQASVNTIFSVFLGFVFLLQLLRYVITTC